MQHRLCCSSLLRTGTSYSSYTIMQHGLCCSSLLRTGTSYSGYTIMQHGLWWKKEQITWHSSQSTSLATLKLCCQQKIATLADRHFKGSLPPCLASSLCAYQPYHCLFFTSKATQKGREFIERDGIYEYQPEVVRLPCVSLNIMPSWVGIGNTIWSSCCVLYTKL